MGANEGLLAALLVFGIPVLFCLWLRWSTRSLDQSIQMWLEKGAELRANAPIILAGRKRRRK